MTTSPAQPPDRRNLLVFAALWPVFFLVLAWVTLLPGAPLLAAAGFTGVCLLVSLAFNREQRFTEQLWGLAMPVGLALLGAAGPAATAVGLDPAPVRGASAFLLVLIGTAGCLGVLASPTSGHMVYGRWMAATLPLGWTISRAVLALTFYLVFTPIGLMMRLAGRDPLQRTFDPAAKTYWNPRRPQADRARYLRQS